MPIASTLMHTICTDRPPVLRYAPRVDIVAHRIRWSVVSPSCAAPTSSFSIPSHRERPNNFLLRVLLLRHYQVRFSVIVKLADPLSIAASVLAVAIQSTKSLYATVQCLKDRHDTLRRLQQELKDLANILNLLTQVINAEMSVLVLQGPICRCGNMCLEFQQSMKLFSGKSKTTLRDWMKMEFRRGDMNEFIDTITSYRRTISVGLGKITLLVAIHYVLQALLTCCYDTCIQSFPSSYSKVQWDDPGHGI